MDSERSEIRQLTYVRAMKSHTFDSKHRMLRKPIIDIDVVMSCFAIFCRLLRRPSSLVIRLYTHRPYELTVRPSSRPSVWTSPSPVDPLSSVNRRARRIETSKLLWKAFYLRNELSTVGEISLPSLKVL